MKTKTMYLAVAVLMLVVFAAGGGVFAVNAHEKSNPTTKSASGSQHSPASGMSEKSPHSKGSMMKMCRRMMKKHMQKMMDASGEQGMKSKESAVEGSEDDRSDT